MTNSFRMQLSPLVEAHPDWGTVGVVPWDTETFGFPVADFHVGQARVTAANSAEIRGALRGWAAREAVEHVVCTVSANDRLTLAVLPKIDFEFFDYSYDVALPRLQAIKFAEPHSVVRPAEDGDVDDIVRIAGDAFRYGRYHADPYVPIEYGSERYRKWVRNAYAGLNDTSLMFVIGPLGGVKGFLHTVIEGETAKVTIMAIDDVGQRGVAGYNLCASTFHRLKALGIRRVVSKISATNLGVLNIIGALGFRCAAPQAVYYWHAPSTPHLLTFSQACDAVGAEVAAGEEV